MGPRVLVIDNYDSFVYNLVQYLGEAGAEPVVWRNDAIDLAGARAVAPDLILISPGPGRPMSAGVSNDVIRHLGPTVPTLGVCLGHQCVAEVFGGEVVPAEVIMHGKTSWIHHRGVGVLAGVSDPFEATRYHSLVVKEDSLPPDVEVTARSAEGVVMALRHRRLPIEGVQFHPESVLTESGRHIISNFLASARPPS
ncbi:MAG: anthranilate synthase component II [Acidimicrobiales bacterium]